MSYEDAKHQLEVWKHMIKVSHDILEKMFKDIDALKEVFTIEEINVIRHLISIDLDGLKGDLERMRDHEEDEYFRMIEGWSEICA